MTHSKDSRKRRSRQEIEDEKQAEAWSERQRYIADVKAEADKANEIALQTADAIAPLLDGLRAGDAAKRKELTDGLKWLAYRGVNSFVKKNPNVKRSHDSDCVRQGALVAALEAIQIMLRRLAKANNKTTPNGVLAAVTTRVNKRIGKEYKRRLPTYLTRHHYGEAKAEAIEQLRREGREQTPEAINELINPTLVSIDAPDSDDPDDHLRHYNSDAAPRAWVASGGLADTQSTGDSQLDQLIEEVTATDLKRSFLTSTVIAAERYIPDPPDWQRVAATVLRQLREKWPTITAKTIERLREELKAPVAEAINLTIQEIEYATNQTVLADRNNSAGRAADKPSSGILTFQPMPGRQRSPAVVAA